MQTVTIDTHEAIEALRAKKFTKEQAKGIVDTICSVELYGVATTDDIRQLEKRIIQQGADLRLEMANLKADLLKWLIPILLGQSALIVGLVKWIV